MYLEGQIVADTQNQQLVMYLGVYQVIGDDNKPHLAAVYMTEEKFKGTGKDITLNDCLINIPSSHIQGIPFIHDSFDVAKEAIKKADKVLTQAWRREYKGNDCKNVYTDCFEINLVDDKVVFTKNEGLSKGIKINICNPDDEE
jgi:hypothetical protein